MGTEERQLRQTLLRLSKSRFKSSFEKDPEFTRRQRTLEPNLFAGFDANGSDNDDLGTTFSASEMYGRHCATKTQTHPTLAGVHQAREPYDY